ncbi:endo-beta-N-acetylglucosaminidase H [Microbacterium luticocti]|uniref:endo-beta-N-acetylglucosaminidase H n=1 Tax=Microbacterium luticocti TaxID=451764 RepID=UPI0004189530|nr:endo-beta-N-acetylglucosaminidase H [Microbacterium luticocti]
MTTLPSPQHRWRFAAVAAVSIAVAALGAPAAASATTDPAAASTAGSVAAHGHHDPTPAPGSTDPKRVVYVEVNSNDMANVADYTLAGTTRPVFDMAMIFAANINYDTTTHAAYLSFNDRVTETLDDAEHQIRPLQKHGTKVLLSVLGNHQGAGFANFTSQADAAAFADQLADAVHTYGLDGIDFDDEWAEYGKNGTAQPNGTSFAYLLDALRDRLGPDKLITLYDIGPAYQTTDWAGTGAAADLDYAWNPYYGAWLPPQLPDMSRAQFGAAAVDLTATPQSASAALAQRTVDEGYGVYVTYNLTAGDHSDYLSAITEPLTGHATAYKAPWYDVSVSTQATCTGHSVKLKTRVASAERAKLDVTVTSSLGSRSFPHLGAGQSRVLVQHARHGATADGTVTVRVDGPDGVLDLLEPYRVPACR